MLRPEAEVGAPGEGVSRGEGGYWQQHPAPAPVMREKLMPLEVAGCCVAGAWGVREMGGGEVEKDRLEGTFWGPWGVMERWVLREV